MKKLNLKIDMDKKCTKCGDPGAMEGGLCMKCVANSMDPPIGEKVLAMIQTQISELFEIHEHKINQAIQKNANELSVGFTTEMKLNSSGTVALKTTISFTAEKIKYSSDVAMVSENQEELPLQ